MIRSKKELDFYNKADYMMNRGSFRPSIKRRLIGIIAPDYIMRYIKAFRKYGFYSNVRGGINSLQDCINWNVINLA